MEIGILKKNKFINDVKKLLSANVFSAFILALSIPIISKIYMPDAIGQYQQILGIIVLIGTLSSFKLDFYIVTCKKGKALTNVVAFALYFLVLISIMTFFVFYYFSDYIGINIKYNYIYISLGVLFFGLYNILTSVTVRYGDYKKISLAKITQVFSHNILSVSIGLVNVGSFSLIFAYICSVLFSCLRLLDNFKKIKYVLNRKSDINYIIKAYGRKTTNITVNSLLNTLSTNLPYILFPIIYGTKEAGLFALALRILDLPLGFISSSISLVYIKYADDEYKKGISFLRFFYKKTAMKLFIISICYSLFLWLISYFILPYFFTDEWSNLPYIIIAMIFAKFAQLLYYPLISTVAIINKPGILTLPLIIILFFRILALYFGVDIDFLYAIIIYSIITGIGFISLNVLSYVSIK